MKYSFLVVLFLSNISWALDSSKFTYGLRMNANRFSESKIAAGSFGIGNPDLSLNYFLKPHHSIGTGLDAYMSINAVNLWSIRINYHYYFKGQGFPTISEGPNHKIEQISKTAMYIGPELRNYHYFLSNEQEAKLTLNDENFENNGSYFNICAKIGYEYRFNPTYTLSAELSQGIFSLAATDDRFNNLGTIFLFGLIIKP